MEASQPTNATADLKQLEEEFKQLEIRLPKESWLGDTMHFYQDFWCVDSFFEGIFAFQNLYQALDSDIIIANLPKTGTTWLKSLLFTIVNRKRISPTSSQHPLRTKFPHELIPYLDFHVFKKINANQEDLTNASIPRVFATHVPYQSLPISIKTSRCKIVYICRNPLDTFVSFWNFSLQCYINKEVEPITGLMEECLGKFCKGKSPYGPYNDHVISYWKESVQNPEKVHLLEYEGLKKEPKAHLKMLAEFLNCPFSNEELKGNILDEIVNLCSLKSLKEMEVNKSGMFYSMVENKALFRKGEVGDWTNYLTPSMAKKFDQMKESLKKAGFSFKYYQL